MSNLSDIIECFILDHIGGENKLQVSRNELAQFFKVAPSQINYVLSTRFTTDRGYIVESRRGGGGGITIIKVVEDEGAAATTLRSLGEMEELTVRQAENIAARLFEENLIDSDEAELLLSCVGAKALANPFGLHNKIRLNIMMQAVKSIAGRNKREELK